MQPLSGHFTKPPEVKHLLHDLADWAPEGLGPDYYGTGELIEGFEREIAQQLGKPAAVFMPSGTMAQQCALHVWAQRGTCRRVALHPRSHLLEDEENAICELAQMKVRPVGGRDRLVRLEDLEAVHEPLSALLLELPQRRIGGQLPAWESLQEQLAWAGARDLPVHLDGARLWESQPFYQRSLAEICRGFSSVYVSFYKGLGGFAGAMLAGSESMVAAARVWRSRYGGSIFQLFPMVLAARRGWKLRGSKFQRYHSKAVEIAGALEGIEGLNLVPRGPHTNMMSIYIDASEASVREAAEQLAAESGIRIFPWLASSEAPRWAMFELTVGDSTLEIETGKIVELLQGLMQRVRGR